MILFSPTHIILLCSQGKESLGGSTLDSGPASTLPLASSPWRKTKFTTTRTAFGGASSCSSTASGPTSTEGPGMRGRRTPSFAIFRAKAWALYTWEGSWATINSWSSTISRRGCSMFSSSCHNNSKPQPTGWAAWGKSCPPWKPSTRKKKGSRAVSTKWGSPSRELPSSTSRRLSWSRCMRGRRSSRTLSPSPQLIEMWSRLPTDMKFALNRLSRTRLSSISRRKFLNWR